MNKIDDEATRYDGANKKNDHMETGKTVKKHGLKRVAVNAGAGILIGGVSTALMGMKVADAVDGEETPNGNLKHPEWVDDEVAVAETVNNGMTFGDAFAAAREEVGPGGVFEWKGKLYGTYTKEEWDNMTADEKSEYGNHFSWNHIDKRDSEILKHTNKADGEIETEENINTDKESAVRDLDDDAVKNEDAVSVDEIDVLAVDEEIEILGVEPDDVIDINDVDGGDIVFIDVDSDGVIDSVDEVSENLDNNTMGIQESAPIVEDFNRTEDIFTTNYMPDQYSDTIYEA